MVKEHNKCSLLNCYLPGDHRNRGTPVPFPNTEVKPVIVDGTAWATVWKSRTLPGFYTPLYRLKRCKGFFYNKINNMKINILKLKNGAQNASGLTVIIDVFRAFSTQSYMFKNNAKSITAVADENIAYQIKKENNNAILIGERDGIKLPQFDFGNSPHEINGHDFSDKDIVHTTSSGTQGIALAKGADEIICAAFVNADAVVRYIKEKNPYQLSLVAMGVAMEQEAIEDELCALYIKNALQNIENDFSKMYSIMRNDAELAKFFDDNQPQFHPQDFDLCAKTGVFDFVLKANSGNDGKYLIEKHEV